MRGVCVMSLNLLCMPILGRDFVDKTSNTNPALPVLKAHSCVFGAFCVDFVGPTGYCIQKVENLQKVGKNWAFLWREFSNYLRKSPDIGYPSEA